MKKHFLAFLMLFTVISIAVAQPANTDDGDRLFVEIVSYYENDHYSHPQHPATGIGCPLGKRFWFTTNREFSWYQWETSFNSSSTGTDDIFLADAYGCGYIKVTVGDSNGRIGTDSIWFNLKGHPSPLGDFIMEIGDDLYPTFSGIATSEHYKLELWREYKPGNSGQAKYFL